MQELRLIKVVISIGLVYVVVLICCITNVFHHTASLFISLGAEWSLALVNGIVTTVLVAISALHMLEARRIRYEAVKPIMSLQPAMYLAGGASFLLLHLVNGGVVARDVEIDTFYRGNRSSLYVSSMGTGERSPILHAPDRSSFPESGGIVKVRVKYKDTYGKKHIQDLSLDFDSLVEVGRQISYILSPFDVIAGSLRDIERELRSIRRR